MSKRKVVICKLLFAIVVFSLFLSTWFVEGVNGLRLFNLIADTFAVWWLYERVEKFGLWLQKPDY